MKRKLLFYSFAIGGLLLVLSMGCKKKDDSSSSNVSLPTVTTASITNLTAVSATSGGNVTSDGGGTITARGVCWNTAQNPTLANSHSSDGTGAGSFTSNLTGLYRYTPYYARAFATNSAGTSYGNQVTFTTPLAK